MESMLNLSKNSSLWIWSILGLAVLGTYLWRGLGVALSEKLTQDSPLFRWITCVTYAMVAALVIRIIVLPVGLLAEMPLAARLTATGVALVIMLKMTNGLVPALMAGTSLMMILAWLL
jgi:branched-subunit amino acid transport protein